MIRVETRDLRWSSRRAFRRIETKREDYTVPIKVTCFRTLLTDPLLPAIISIIDISTIDISEVLIMPRMNSSLVPGQPLTPAVFHILLALADGDKHGYAIMKDVENQTTGRLKLGPGTLYGTIKRLLAADLITEIDERADPELGDERRRYYRLTANGRKLAWEENQRLTQAVKTARLKRLSDTPLD